MAEAVFLFIYDEILPFLLAKMIKHTVFVVPYSFLTALCHNPFQSFISLKHLDVLHFHFHQQKENAILYILRSKICYPCWLISSFWLNMQIARITSNNGSLLFRALVSRNSWLILKLTVQKDFCSLIHEHVSLIQSRKVKQAPLIWSYSENKCFSACCILFVITYLFLGAQDQCRRNVKYNGFFICKYSFSC